MNRRSFKDLYVHPKVLCGNYVLNSMDSGGAEMPPLVHAAGEADQHKSGIRYGMHSFYNF